MASLSKLYNQQFVKAKFIHPPLRQARE